MTIEINLVIDPKIFIDTKFWLTSSYTLNIFRTKNVGAKKIQHANYPRFFLTQLFLWTQKVLFGLKVRMLFDLDQKIFQTQTKKFRSNNVIGLKFL